MANQVVRRRPKAPGGESPLRDGLPLTGAGRRHTASMCRSHHILRRHEAGRRLDASPGDTQLLYLSCEDVSEARHAQDNGRGGASLNAQLAPAEANATVLL